MAGSDRGAKPGKRAQGSDGGKAGKGAAAVGKGGKTDAGARRSGEGRSAGRPRGGVRAVTRPRRARRPRRSWWTRLGPLLVSLAGGGLLAAALVWLLPLAPPAPQSAAPVAPAAPARSAPPGAAPLAPVFEEAPPDSTPAERLRRVDEAIFRGLREAGVPPEAVRVTLGRSPDGELTVFQVQPPPGLEQTRPEKALRLRLAELPVQAVWRREAGNLILELRQDGRLSHRVSLGPGAPPATPAPPPPPRPLPPPAPPSAGGKPRAAIVIDDLGYQLAPARRLMALGLPLSLSILPHAPHGQEIAEQATVRGLQVLLHLPMEPHGYPHPDPGPGALLAGMPPEELRQVLLADLATVPGAAGANNHMGSRLSEDEGALAVILAVLRERGLFFLDSYTSPRTRAAAMAWRLGLASGRRDLFLDHDPRPGPVHAQLERFLTLARGHSGLIAIGHPHPATLEALERLAPRLREELELVPVGNLLGKDQKDQGVGRAPWEESPLPSRERNEGGP